MRQHHPSSIHPRIPHPPSTVCPWRTIMEQTVRATNSSSSSSSVLSSNRRSMSESVPHAPRTCHLILFFTFHSIFRLQIPCQESMRGKKISTPASTLLLLRLCPCVWKICKRDINLSTEMAKGSRTRRVDHSRTLFLSLALPASLRCASKDYFHPLAVAALPFHPGPPHQFAIRTVCEKYFLISFVYSPPPSQGERVAGFIFCTFGLFPWRRDGSVAAAERVRREVGNRKK